MIPLVLPPSDFTIEAAREGGFDLFRHAPRGVVLVHTFPTRAAAEAFQRSALAQKLRTRLCQLSGATPEV